METNSLFIESQLRGAVLHNYLFCSVMIEQLFVTRYVNLKFPPSTNSNFLVPVKVLEVRYSTVSFCVGKSPWIFLFHHKVNLSFRCSHVKWYLQHQK